MDLFSSVSCTSRKVAALRESGARWCVKISQHSDPDRFRRRVGKPSGRFRATVASWDPPNGLKRHPADAGRESGVCARALASLAE